MGRRNGIAVSPAGSIALNSALVRNSAVAAGCRGAVGGRGGRTRRPRVPVRCAAGMWRPPSTKVPVGTVAPLCDDALMRAAKAADGNADPASNRPTRARRLLSFGVRRE